jgi:hypothetical protein
MRPKDIAPLIYEGSKRKNCTTGKALEEEFWISQVNTQDGLSVDHILLFTTLWERLQEVHLNINLPDLISWKVYKL